MKHCRSGEDGLARAAVADLSRRYGVELGAEVASPGHSYYEVRRAALAEIRAAGVTAEQAKSLEFDRLATGVLEEAAAAPAGLGEVFDRLAASFRRVHDGS